MWLPALKGIMVDFNRLNSSVSQYYSAEMAEIRFFLIATDIGAMYSLMFKYV